MISEQRLRELEDSPWAMDRPPVTDKEFRLFIAAARVANAAARVEREERDMRGWTPCLSADKQAPYDPQHHVNRARADLARALRLYTAPRPAEVPT